MQLTFQHPWLHVRQVLQQQLQLVCRKQGRCCMQLSLHQGPAACPLVRRPARLLQQQLQQGWLVCLPVLVLLLLCRAVSGQWQRLICHRHWQCQQHQQTLHMQMLSCSRDKPQGTQQQQQQQQQQMRLGSRKCPLGSVQQRISLACQRQLVLQQGWQMLLLPHQWLAYLQPHVELNLRCFHHLLQKRQLQRVWLACLLVLLLCRAVSAQWPWLICRCHWQCQQQPQQQSALGCMVELTRCMLLAHLQKQQQQQQHMMKIGG
jgi:hypothetical protein